jgi:hypothetical protein
MFYVVRKQLLTIIRICSVLNAKSTAVLLQTSYCVHTTRFNSTVPRKTADAIIAQSELNCNRFRQLIR